MNALQLAQQQLNKGSRYMVVALNVHGKLVWFDTTANMNAQLFKPETLYVSAWVTHTNKREAERCFNSIKAGLKRNFPTAATPSWAGLDFGTLKSLRIIHIGAVASEVPERSRKRKPEQWPFPPMDDDPAASEYKGSSK